jgi:hypothetical protein
MITSALRVPRAPSKSPTSVSVPPKGSAMVKVARLIVAPLAPV